MDSSDPHFISLGAVTPPARFLDLVLTPLEKYSQGTLHPAQNSSAAALLRVFFLPRPEIVTSAPDGFKPQVLQTQGVIQEEGFHLLGPLRRAGSRFLSCFEPCIPGMMEIWTWPRHQPKNHTFGCIQRCNKCTEGAEGSPHPIPGISQPQDPQAPFFYLKPHHPHSGSGIKIKSGTKPPPLQRPGLKYSWQPNAFSFPNVIVKVNLEAAFPPILGGDEPPSSRSRAGPGASPGGDPQTPGVA